MPVASMKAPPKTSSDEAALHRFEEGLKKSIKQYKAAKVETFEDKDKFLRTLVE